MNPKTSKTQLEILKILSKGSEELTGYEITKRLYPNTELRIIVNRKNFIYKILDILAKKKIVIKKKSYPCFYKITPSLKNNIETTMKMLEVECPSCKRTSWVREIQTTKQCECLKPNNKPRRFWVTKQRLTGKMKVV